MTRAPLLFVSLLLCAAPLSASPPDVVLVIADDMDRRHFEHVTAAAATPNLERLRQVSTEFPNGWAHARCAPSLASILTGLRPHEHGFYFNFDQSGLDREVDPCASFTARLASVGYRCFQGGKWWYGPQSDFGFEDAHDDRLRFARLNQTRLFDWIDSLAPDDPMFVWWAPMLPHTPHNEAQRHVDAVGPVEVPAYVPPPRAADFIEEETELLAMTHWFDEALGELFEKLDAVGRAQNLVVVFLIDNGWVNGLVSKGSPYEAAFQTPIWVTAPGHRQNAVVGDLVSLRDVYATVLGFAGLANDRAEAVDLGGYLRGEAVTPRGSLRDFCYPAFATAQAHRDDAYAVLVRDDRFKLVAWTRDVVASDNGILKIQHILTDFPTRAAETIEFYDLDADPFELSNLWGSPSFAAEQAALLAQAEEFYREAR